MTLDEAIKHAEEVADFCNYEACKYDMNDPFESYMACKDEKCAEEHRQLAEWLKDYKRLLEQQPCEDCISRQAAMDAISRVGLCKCSTDEVRAVDECLRAVEALPPVTPQPKTGYWIGIDEEPHEDWECDNCGFVIWADESIEKFHYCPNCGAKMVEPQESEET